ncbi:MAG: 50S ribosomal protein L11 methyltransferase [Candidatus Omnitrophota bacterium]
MTRPPGRQLKLKMNYELKISVPHYSGANHVLTGLLCTKGFDLSDIIETHDQGQTYLSVYFSEDSSAGAFAQQIRALSSDITVDVRRWEDAQWRDKWKESLRPFPLGKNFMVVPVWHADHADCGSRTPICLDTVLSFGTGEHETTRFTAEYVEEYAGGVSNFLDAGTGTGLLAVLAAKCGARTVWAVDIDLNSINTAQANARANGVVLDRCEQLDIREIPDDHSFDFIAANIITDELIALKGTLLNILAPGGYLALSGISLGNLERLCSCYDGDARLCRCGIKTGKEWAALLYQRCEEGGI